VFVLVAVGPPVDTAGGTDADGGAPGRRRRLADGADGVGDAGRGRTAARAARVRWPAGLLGDTGGAPSRATARATGGRHGDPRERDGGVPVPAADETRRAVRLLRLPPGDGRGTAAAAAVTAHAAAEGVRFPCGGGGHTPPATAGTAGDARGPQGTPRRRRRRPDPAAPGHANSAGGPGAAGIAPSSRRIPGEQLASAAGAGSIAIGSGAGLGGGEDCGDADDRDDVVSAEVDVDADDDVDVEADVDVDKHEAYNVGVAVGATGVDDAADVDKEVDVDVDADVDVSIGAFTAESDVLPARESPPRASTALGGEGERTRAAADATVSAQAAAAAAADCGGDDEDWRGEAPDDVGSSVALVAGRAARSPTAFRAGGERARVRDSRAMGAALASAAKNGKFAASAAPATVADVVDVTVVIAATKAGAADIGGRGIAARGWQVSRMPARPTKSCGWLTPPAGRAATSAAAPRNRVSAPLGDVMAATGPPACAASMPWM